MDFTFIHAADLHIDSPLAALGRANAEAAAFFARASRSAAQALVEETIASKAAFLIIAGDVFDGDWTHVTTGLFLMRELVKLERAGIQVFMLRGNHDAESRMSRSLDWPGNVREFSTRKAESFTIEALQTVLHGRGFRDRAVEENFVSTYPARRGGWLNIGVLHTSLDGRPGHDPYAPCSVSSLQLFGYDYWALGHIHQADIVSRDPWIVYPGNLQGRSIRETGAKGAMRVHVRDGRIAQVEPVVLDAARWVHAKIAIGDCASLDDVLARIHTGLEHAHAEAGGKPLAVRVTLSGVTALHERLLADRATLDEQALGLAERVSAQCWIEKIKLETAPLPLVATLAPDLETKSLALDGILDEALADPEYGAQFAGLAQEVTQKLPPELRAKFESEILGNGKTAEAARYFLSGVLRRGQPV